jgi:hypothetical protein
LAIDDSGANRYDPSDKEDENTFHKRLFEIKITKLSSIAHFRFYSQ